MNNLQDEEKDLFIRKKLEEDKLVSKKFDDVFENFLKGEHEMKEEQKNKAKDKKIKKKNNKWLKPFTAVAACTLVVAGANVYATTQGYDNIFFLIKDLGNKNKTSTLTAQKDEILSDRDTTISYTNLEIADGLFIQINKFVVKDGKASLIVKVNQEKAKVKPEKFILTSNNVILVDERIEDENQNLYSETNISEYTYEIKINGYKDEMKVLAFKILGPNLTEITELKIDLENKEIDLLGSSNSNDDEISKISEIDLKEKLGYYAIIFHPNATSKVLNDDDKFFLGSNLYINAKNETTKVSNDGYVYYPKNDINSALTEAIGDELGTTIHSETFTYDKELNGYKYIVAGDMSTSGLCLNIDDLKYENGRYVVTFTYCLPTEQHYIEGTIEDLDRYQVTVEFSLNKNETYTKYKLLNLGNVEPIKVENDKSDDVNELPTEQDTSSNFAQNHSEYEINDTTNNSNKPNYDPSTVNNYASTMNWTEYWAPGLKFQYPTDWEFSSNQRDGGKGIMVNAEATGWAIGKNPDTGEIIESYVTIEVYDQVIAYGNTPEEAYNNFAEQYRFKENKGCYYTNNNGDEWHDFWDDSQMYDDVAGDTYYVHASEVWDGGAPSGKYVIDMVRILTDNKNNFKVTNITNYVIGNLKTTSK